MYTEECFNKKMFTNGLNCLKKVKIDEDSSGRTTIVSKSEMVDSINAIIFWWQKRYNREHFWMLGIFCGYNA